MNATRQRTRRDALQQPAAKIPATRPTLRECMAFTCAEVDESRAVCELRIPQDVASRRLGRSLLLRLQANVEVIADATPELTDGWAIFIDHSIDDGTFRGKVVIETATATASVDGGPWVAREVLARAAGALLAEVKS